MAIKWPKAFLEGFHLDKFADVEEIKTVQRYWHGSLSKKSIKAGHE